MTESSEIDGLGTYEPQRIEDVLYKDKKVSVKSRILISEKG